MIPDRFELMARNNPNRLAVKTGKEELSYDELNKAANRVADAILQQPRSKRYQTRKRKNCWFRKTMGSGRA